MYKTLQLTHLHITLELYSILTVFKTRIIKLIYHKNKINKSRVLTIFNYWDDEMRPIQSI